MKKENIEKHMHELIKHLLKNNKMYDEVKIKVGETEIPYVVGFGIIPQSKLL